MLDKKIPFKSMIMYRKAQEVLDVEFSSDYRMIFFNKGDEYDWARIETSVLEFDSEEHALDRFQKQFLSVSGEVEQRVMFLEHIPSGEKIGTITVWWKYANEKRIPVIDWVAIIPDYQGKNLARAMVSFALNTLIKLEGLVDCLLSTQTWSHKAIKLYRNLGFEFDYETSPKNIYNGKILLNETKEAEEILEKLNLL